METCDQILHAKWIITCEEKNQVLENHALVIKGNKIHNILPSATVSERYQGPSIQLNNHALIPGLINAHTHLAMNFFRGLADDLALMDWLTHHVWPAENKWLSDEFVYDASLFAMAEMIRSGTTCFNDMFFFMPATARATEISCLRGFLSMHVITLQTKWAKNIEEELEKAEAFYQEFKNSKHVNITAGIHSMYTVTENQHLLRVKAIADKYNLQINMHVQEPRSEIETLMNQTQSRPLARLKELDMLNSKLIAVHMLHVNDEDFSLLEHYKPNIVHCPESNMKLASGICPVSELLARGVNVALGTDGAASNNDLNMIGEMRTAAFLAKHHTHNPESLSAEQVLKMATINGAKALGIDHLIGSLTAGKLADITAIKLNEIETFPIYHPISQIVYAASRHQVSDVWVGGKQLLKNRKLTTLDEQTLLENAQHWGEKIKNT